jgi:hypothetical protein
MSLQFFAQTRKMPAKSAFLCQKIVINTPEPLLPVGEN